MEAIGKLLQQGQGDDHAARAAAFVVDATNAAIKTVTGLSLTDARANSVQFQVVTIHVSHGAVAGKIQQQAQDICDFINQRLHQAGSKQPHIQRLVTRLK